MMFSRIVLLIIFTLAFCKQSLLAQELSAAAYSKKVQYAASFYNFYDEQTSSSPKFYQRFWQGGHMSFGRWDFPLIAASLLSEKRNSGHIARVSPSEIDYEITEHVASDDDKNSFGALTPSYYPTATGTFRLAGMLMLDAFTGIDYSPATYSKLINFHKALFYTAAFTHFSKQNFPRTRPDRSDTRSFFSGHTSTVFATSTFLYLEARDFIHNLDEEQDGLPLLSARQWELVSIGALYGWAGYVGYSRIRDRKHYLSDVIVGALAGSVISYLVYPRTSRLKVANGMKFGVQPARGGAAIGMNLKF